VHSFHQMQDKGFEVRNVKQSNAKLRQKSQDTSEGRHSFEQLIDLLLHHGCICRQKVSVGKRSKVRTV
jgi:hypothetical protein